MMTKKRIYLAGAVVAGIGLMVFIAFQLKPDGRKYYKVKKGNLDVVISSKGDLKGEKYTEINIPDALCNEELRVYQYKLADVITEGKVVKQGEYIAKLDESQLVNMMQDIRQQKEKMDADLRNIVLDSAVNLTGRREDISNARLDLEYLKIDLEQSKYESEAYQRKTQMSYQKAEIGMEKIRRDYLLAKNRLKLQVGRFQAYVDQFQKRIDNYQKALGSTIINAPESGIVMFAKDHSGKSYGKDTEVNIWRPLIATLPDMSVVITESYIREIDISKISIGDSVKIKVDALPKKTFHGKVIKVANIGEDHKDFDMKVFKVVIRLDESDPEMKPGMSANNDIVIGSYRDRLLIPMKAVFSKNNRTVVYLKKGGEIIEQEITLVTDNGTFGIVDKNIKSGDLLLLYQPEEFKTLAANSEK